VVRPFSDFSCIEGLGGLGTLWSWGRSGVWASLLLSNDPCSCRAAGSSHASENGRGNDKTLHSEIFLTESCTERYSSQFKNDHLAEM